MGRTEEEKKRRRKSRENTERAVFWLPSEEDKSKRKDNQLCQKLLIGPKR